MSLNNLRNLVTGAGGIGGVNFVRALRLIGEQNNINHSLPEPTTTHTTSTFLDSMQDTEPPSTATQNF
ncbi:MAG: hypothetical protein ACP5GN_07775 [Fervidicoccaceae archaeon]|jgi:predicted ATPase